MTMTSLAPTSRWAMRPSGDTLDLVNPGISVLRFLSRDLLRCAWQTVTNGVLADRAFINLLVLRGKVD
jgi:hypothetical protein